MGDFFIVNKMIEFVRDLVSKQEPLKGWTHADPRYSEFLLCFQNAEMTHSDLKDGLQRAGFDARVLGTWRHKGDHHHIRFRHLALHGVELAHSLFLTDDSRELVGTIYVYGLFQEAVTVANRMARKLGPIEFSTAQVINPRSVHLDGIKSTKEIVAEWHLWDVDDWACPYEWEFLTDTSPPVEVADALVRAIREKLGKRVISCLFRGQNRGFQFGSGELPSHLLERALSEMDRIGDRSKNREIVLVVSENEQEEQTPQSVVKIEISPAGLTVHQSVVRIGLARCDHTVPATKEETQRRLGVFFFIFELLGLKELPPEYFDDFGG